MSADTEAYDTAIGAVTAGGPLTIRDSTIRDITPGATATVVARGDVTIQRSTITHGEVNAGSALHVMSPAVARNVVVDSSLLRGGNTSVLLDVGSAASQVALRGVTLMPSWDSNGWSVDLAGEPGATARATIANSLLLTRPVRAAGGAQATCSWTQHLAHVAPAAATRTAPAPRATPAPTAPCATTSCGSTATSRRAPTRRRSTPPAPAASRPASRPPTASAARARPPATTPATPVPGAATRAPSSATARGRRSRSPAPSASRRAPRRQFTAITNAIEPAYVWSFGDESTGPGEQTTTHTFATGRSKVTLEVTDRAYGCTSRVSQDVTVTTPPSAAGAARDRTAPRLTKVKLVRARIARRKNGALRFTLSEAATVTITVARRKGKRYVAARTVKVKGRRGANRVTLSAKKLRLRRASFRVRITARDSAGNTAKAVARRLTVR